MTTARRRMRQVMDWRASLQAGLIAGAVLLVIMLIGYPAATGGSVWTVFRFIASLLLGRELLLSPEFSSGIVLLALILHMDLAVVYTWILAFIIHRWGLIVGFLAQGVPAFDAAVLGCYVHAQAGIISAELIGTSASVLAGDVADAVPMAISELEIIAP